VLGRVLGHVPGHVPGHVLAMASHLVLYGRRAVRAIVLAANRQGTRCEHEIEPGDREQPKATAHCRPGAQIH
jgi:hypothetical protein